MYLGKFIPSTLTSNLEMSSAVNEADVVDGLARVVSLVGVCGRRDVQAERTFAGLRDKPEEMKRF